MQEDGVNAVVRKQFAVSTGVEHSESITQIPDATREELSASMNLAACRGATRRAVLEGVGGGTNAGGASLESDSGSWVIAQQQAKDVAHAFTVRALTRSALRHRVVAVFVSNNVSERSVVAAATCDVEVDGVARVEGIASGCNVAGHKE